MTTMQASPKMPDNRKANLLDNERFLASAMILPAFTYIIVLVGFPFVFAILYAFSDATIGAPQLDKFTFTTFQNVLRNPNFQLSLWNTFFFSFISQIIMVFLANVLAVALSADFPGKWFVRLLILLPWATPIAVSAIGWMWLFEPTYSPLDWILREVGILGQSCNPEIVGCHQGWLMQLGLVDKGLYDGSVQMLWFGRTGPARLGVIIMYVWRMLPMSTVIIMAGLTSIPGDVKDAVAVDEWVDKRAEGGAVDAA